MGIGLSKADRLKGKVRSAVPLKGSGPAIGQPPGAASAPANAAAPPATGHPSEGIGELKGGLGVYKKQFLQAGLDDNTKRLNAFSKSNQQSSIFEGGTDGGVGLNQNKEAVRAVTSNRARTRDYRLARREAIRRNDRLGAARIGNEAASQGFRLHGIGKSGEDYNAANRELQGAELGSASRYQSALGGLGDTGQGATQGAATGEKPATGAQGSVDGDPPPQYKPLGMNFDSSYFDSPNTSTAPVSLTGADSGGDTSPYGGLASMIGGGGAIGGKKQPTPGTLGASYDFSDPDVLDKIRARVELGTNTNDNTKFDSSVAARNATPASTPLPGLPGARAMAPYQAPALSGAKPHLPGAGGPGAGGLSTGDREFPEFFDAPFMKPDIAFEKAETHRQAFEASLDGKAAKFLKSAGSAWKWLGKETAEAIGNAVDSAVDETSAAKSRLLAAKQLHTKIGEMRKTDEFSAEEIKEAEALRNKLVKQQTPKPSK